MQKHESRKHLNAIQLYICDQDIFHYIWYESDKMNEVEKWKKKLMPYWS